MDQSGLYAMEDVLVDLRKQDIRCIICKLIKATKIYDGTY